MRYAILLNPLLAILILACRENNPAPMVTSTLTEQPTAAANGVPPSRKLAFTSCMRVDTEGHASCGIYVVSADGSGLTRVADGGRWPAWSPDGSRLVFLGEDKQISVVNADGSGLTRLAESGDLISAPAWSPDGTRIVFVRGQENLAVVAADGSGEPAYIDNPGVSYYFFTPAWSPDGQPIVVQLVTQDPFDTELYLINPDFSGLTRLTDMEQTPSFPAWSPDGSRIVFEAEGDLYLVNADGSGVTRLTSGPAEDYHPAWSPDGSHIAFISCPGGVEGNGGRCAVSVMTADGAGSTSVTDLGVQNARPTWSPDGARIAFSSCDASGCGVRVVGADGSGLTRIAQAPTSGVVATVAWSPTQ